MSELAQIAKTLNDPNNLKNDFSEVAAIVMGHFRKKYLDPMHKEYAEQRAKCLKDPCPQVALLQACKPFMHDTSMLDRMIDGISSCNAVIDMVRLNSKELRRSEGHMRKNDTSRENQAQLADNLLPKPPTAFQNDRTKQEHAQERTVDNTTLMLLAAAMFMGGNNGRR